MQFNPLASRRACRGFADAANPRQNKGMRETFHLQRIAQSADKRLLTNQGSKRFWSVFACKNAIGCWCLLAHC
jgi:hypothetical protein